MITILLITLIFLAIVNIIVGILKKTKVNLNPILKENEDLLQSVTIFFEKTEKSIREEFQNNRKEANENAKTSREELSKSLNNFKEQFSENIKEFNDLLKENFSTMNSQQIEFSKQVTENNKANRDELSNNLKSFESKSTENTNGFNDVLRQKFSDFSKQQSDTNKQTTNNVKDIKDLVEKQLGTSREDLTNSLNSFKKQFSENIKEFNELIKEKFSTMNNQQIEFSKQVTENNKANRDELSSNLKSFESKSTENTNGFNDVLRQKFSDFSKQQNEINKQTTDNVKEVKTTIENQLQSIREDNTKQLDKMRKTVDEKLQKTLNDRLSQSFETVNKQLLAVQEGLGEMKTLASDVGGLKKVLSNVKMRGSIGELQLEMLLEQILAPDQYMANVKTNPNSSEFVEFAVKLPGKNDSDSDSVVWLPIDAKFPKDIYQQLIEAYEEGDPAEVNNSKKNMELAIKKMAKDISSKYIDPPNTTDFGIMYLPFEGIYAEVVRNASLLETLMRDYKIIVTGPTTLAAILNSLQMGFKTLAIQKRSSEVWQVLSSVKKEFNNFGGIMDKAQKNIQTGLNQLDDVIGKRTRAIQRKLRNVTDLDDSVKNNKMSEIPDIPLINDDDD